MYRNLVLLIIILLQGEMLSQNGNINKSLKVFFDCNRCDRNYVKEQISFVNYVRDRNDSDVHIQVNSTRTGGGGREYTLTFFGLNRFENNNDTLIYTISESESQDQRRAKLVKNLKLGLIKYIAKTPEGADIVISYKAQNLKKDEDKNDEWNYWVFRTRMRGWINGEKSANSLNLWGSFSVNRITDDLKIRLSLNGNYDQDKYDYEGETYTSISRQQRFWASAIFSHNQNWSYGLFSGLISSIYDNMKLGSSVTAGIEYNIFPYSEYTRKQLRINYRITLLYNNYDEETIYFKNEELVFQEKLAIALDIIQPWGNIETEFLASHYMHDFSLNFLELRTEFRINVISGLTLDLFGRIAYIHDQISLPRTGVELEEVLLRQKQLETNYEYWARFGFTYSFGSIYNNIVNTRFGS